MSRRYRNNPKQNKKTFISILFNKWTLLTILFLVVVILAITAAKITKTHNSAERQKEISETRKKQLNNPEFQSFKKNMTPRLDFEKLKQSEYPELEKEISTAITESKFSGSVLAIKDNKLIINKAFGYSDKDADKKLTTDSDYMIASIQKSFTAVAIMRLVEDKKLTLYTPLSQFYPQIPNSDYITIRNLLDMTSGLFIASHAKTKIEEDDVLEEMLPYVYYEPLYDGWKYSAVNYNILAGIIKQLSGQSYQDYITEQIIKPLKLKDTKFYEKRINRKDTAKSYKWTAKNPYSEEYTMKPGNYAAELGTGNLFTTTSDLLTYFQGLIDGHILRKNNLQTLLTHDLMYYDYTYGGGLYDKGDYYSSHGIIMGFESTVCLSKDGSTGIVFLSNTFNRENMSENLVYDLYTKINTPDEDYNDINQDDMNYEIPVEDPIYY